MLLKRMLWAIAGLICCIAITSATSADEASPVLPAVSELNGKFDFEGGSINGNADFVFRGTVTAPIGDRLGFQVDAELGRFIGSTRAGAGAHLFLRDPEKYLLGVYASRHTWEDINISRLAVEGEIYWDDISFSGLAGYEWLDVPSTKGGLAVLNKDEVSPFVILDFSRYLKDNTKVTIGYNYEAKQSFATVGFETLLQNAKIPTSLYANARSDLKGNNNIRAGVKLHLGGDPSKTLIRRHREDDPQAYSPEFPTLRTQAPATSNGQICTSSICFPQTNNCPTDTKLCRDGATVGRNPNDSCRFYECGTSR